MASLTFPLSVANFFDKLTVTEFRLSLAEPLREARLGDGTVLRASAGEALWRGSMTLAVAPHVDAAAAEALLALAVRPGSSVFIYDPRKRGPASDPEGTALSSSTVLLAAVSTDRREVALSGLPASFVVSPGDMLGFAYGSDPTRYAMHRVVTGCTASAAGTTVGDPCEVIPAVRAGFSISTPTTAVTLVRPAFKAVLSSLEYGSGQGRMTSGAAVSFVQTLR